MLAPFGSLLASAHAHQALTADLSLQEMTGLPAEYLGLALNLALENPDKLRLRATLLGEPAVACRNGQDVWLAPAGKLAPLLNLAPDVPSKSDTRLGNLSLEVPAKELAFLPALFQVRDAGDETVDGAACRVLDLALAPELAQPAKTEGWAARVWVRPDYKLAKLEFFKQHWHVIVAVNKLEFSGALPESTWQPETTEADGVLHLKPGQLRFLLDLVSRGTVPAKTAPSPEP
jgi:hypothetical protein